MRCNKVIALVALSLLLLFLRTPSAAAPAELSPVAQAEINHLLDYVEKSSGCQFGRNDKWYDDTKAVREHLETKLRYFRDKGRIKSADDFIQWAGTKSEISGKPYLVRCEGGPEVPLGAWLTDELVHYRKARSIKS
jgi:hypothetical protein